LGFILSTLVTFRLNEAVKKRTVGNVIVWCFGCIYFYGYLGIVAFCYELIRSYFLRRGIVKRDRYVGRGTPDLF
jgi:hypothetical protein